MTLLQYVDDYYDPAHMDCVQHCMEVFARLAARYFRKSASFRLRCRLVRACLGEEAIQARKLQNGHELEILGVDIS